MKLCEHSLKNLNIYSRIKSAAENDRISHAYIFEGPSSINKIDFAKSFIKCMLCHDKRGENCGLCSICDRIDHDNHEDVMYVYREGNSVKDSVVSMLQEKLNMKPSGERNIVVIADADTMTTRAQNRLLKTLEEPPGKSVIILLSENMENLTQTILSRCVKYRMEGETEAGSDSRADRIVSMAIEGNPFYRIAKEAGECMTNRERAMNLLDSMEQIYRSFLTERKKSVSLYTFDDIYKYIREIEKSRKSIIQGMSPGYALKSFFLVITD